MQAWTPHRYQIDTVRHLLANPAAAAFLEPGLGKTSCTLAAVAALERSAEARRTLVFAPLRVVYRVWPQEVKKWADFSHLRVSIVHGSPEKRLAALRAPADIYVCNYENAKWLAAQRFEFDTLVLDESSKAKDPTTQRSKALLQLRARARRCWILTGTPAPNKADELYGQFRVADEGKRLGRTLTAFRREYMEPEQYPTFIKWHLRPDSATRIQDKVRDITISLRASDHLDLPELLENVIEFDLPPAARAVYKALEDDFLAQLDEGTITVANAAVQSGKLRQVASGACYDEHGQPLQLHDAKLDALEDLVDELGGEPLLCLVAFKHEVDRIRERFPDAPYLGGGQSAAESNRIIDAWNRGEVPLLLGHPASMGHGLNLQEGGAHTMVWFGLSWSNEQFQQAIARLYRQGQRTATTVHYLIARETVDGTVLQVLRSKQAGQVAILNALKKGVASS